MTDTASSMTFVILYSANILLMFAVPIAYHAISISTGTSAQQPAWFLFYPVASLLMNVATMWTLRPLTIRGVTAVAVVIVTTIVLSLGCIGLLVLGGVALAFAGVEGYDLM